MPNISIMRPTHSLLCCSPQNPDTPHKGSKPSPNPRGAWLRVEVFGPSHPVWPCPALPSVSNAVKLLLGLSALHNRTKPDPEERGQCWRRLLAGVMQPSRRVSRPWSHAQRGAGGFVGPDPRGGVEQTASASWRFASDVGFLPPRAVFCFGNVREGIEALNLLGNACFFVHCNVTLFVCLCTEDIHG